MLKTLRFIWSHPLASRSRREAIERYVRWQLASRILDWPIVAPFVGDSKLVAERGMHGATGNIYCGLHEFADMAFLLHFLRPGDWFVDIGANVGSYTVLAAAVVGASCISVEPVPEAFFLLRRNIQINEIASLVTAVNCAIGERDELLLFSLDRGTQNQIVREEYSGSAQSVQVRPLNSVLQDENPIFWKVDVEGHELEVLQGAQQSLANSHLLAVMLEGDSALIRGIMQSHGFELREYDPWERTLRIAECPTAMSNHLWVRQPTSVAARCSAAPIRSVLSVKI